MLHSSDTTVTVTAHAAEVEGALDGWRATCSTCGGQAGFSIKSMTEAWASDHKRLMQEWGK